MIAIERRLAAAAVAVLRGADRLGRGRVRGDGARARQRRATTRGTRTGGIFNAAFDGAAAWNDTLTSGDAAPLHRARRRGRVPDAALQHRRRGPALHRRDLRLRRRDLARAAPRPASARSSRCASAARAGGALWALIPGVLKAFARTNEIITSLMLNYVAGLLLTYLIFDSASPWRDVSTIQTRSFPQSIALKPSQFWPTCVRSTSSSRFGFLLAVGVADGAVRPLPADALRLRDERDRRLDAGRALRGHAHAAEDPRGDGDLRRRRRPRRREPGRRLLARARRQPAGPAGRGFGYTGIVVAALGRYNPFAVVLVGVLHRRAAERRPLPPGRRLPDRPRRRDAGDHPLLRARRRAADPVPRAVRPARGGRRRRRLREWA